MEQLLFTMIYSNNEKKKNLFLLKLKKSSFKTKRNFIKMSIDTKQIIHIASEVVIIGSLSAFFISKTNKMSEQIDELSSKIQEQNNIIQQQNEIIQKHDNLILRLLNTVNLLIQENGNTQQPPPPEKKSLNIPSSKTENKPASKSLSVNKNAKSKPLSIPKPTPLPQVIDSSKKVVIMMPTMQQLPTQTSSSRVEEIIDEE